MPAPHSRDHRAFICASINSGGGRLGKTSLVTAGHRTHCGVCPHRPCALARTHVKAGT
jgi:hypothetical protein